jgi:hypothetical protein
MRSTRKFWPLDFDPEGAIYENPSWDLPGLKRFGKRNPGAAKSPRPGKKP